MSAPSYYEQLSKSLPKAATIITSIFRSLHLDTKYVSPLSVLNGIHA